MPNHTVAHRLRNRLTQASKSARGKQIKAAIKKVAKSKSFQDKLRAVAKQVKSKVSMAVESKCPSCKAGFEFALKQKQVKDFFRGVDQKITEKCKTCGELLDVVVKA